LSPTYLLTAAAIGDDANSVIR